MKKQDKVEIVCGYCRKKVLIFAWQKNRGKKYCSKECYLKKKISSARTKRPHKKYTVDDLIKVKKLYEVNYTKMLKHFPDHKKYAIEEHRLNRLEERIGRNLKKED